MSFKLCNRRLHNCAAEKCRFTRRDDFNCKLRKHNKYVTI